MTKERTQSDKKGVLSLSIKTKKTSMQYLKVKPKNITNYKQRGLLGRLYKTLKP